MQVDHKVAVLSEGIESAFDISRRTLTVYFKLYKQTIHWKETTKSLESQHEVWAKAAAAKGKLIEELRKDVGKSKSTAKR